MFPRDVILREELTEHPLQVGSIPLYDLHRPQMLHHHLPQVIMVVADEHGEDLQSQTKFKVKVNLPCNILTGHTNKRRISMASVKYETNLFVVV